MVEAGKRVEHVSAAGGMAHAVCRELHHGLAWQHHPQLAAQAHGGLHWKGTRDGHSHRESPVGPPWLYPQPSLPHSPHSYLAQPHTFSALCRNSSSSWDFSHWVGQRQSASQGAKAQPHPWEQSPNWALVFVSHLFGVDGEGAGQAGGPWLPGSSVTPQPREKFPAWLPH